MLPLHIHFIKAKNSCNYGTGSFISLHHTKPIGFGEGGLAIIDKEYEKYTRAAVNFGMEEGVFNENGGNYKISEISAAGILQWWDQFNIDNLQVNTRIIIIKQDTKCEMYEGDFWPQPC